MRSLLILLSSVCVMGQDQAERSGIAPALAEAETSPIVRVKRTEPVEVVYLEHVGPYWSLGPRFSQLREYLAEHDYAGPMYARFSSDPTGAAFGSVRSEIGFVSDERHKPAPPFKKSRRRAEFVAYMTLDSPANTTGSYAVMREWISSHGYVALGPVTEVYPSPRDVAITHQRTEIQMPIRSASPAIEESKPVVQETPSEPARQASGRPPPGRPPLLESDLPGPKDLGYPRGVSDTPSPVVEGLAQQTQTDESIADPREVPEAEQVERPALTPVEDLVEAREFDRIAEQLLPDPRAIPHTWRLWLGQLVFRIGAASRGIRRLHPGDDREVTDFADAITRRYKVVSAGFQLDPLAQAVVKFGSQNDPDTAKEKEEIMREMDALLGEITLRSADPKQTVRRLTDIVQRTQDLLVSAER